MGKMYYSEEETCEMLGLDVDGLMELVNDRRLQMYQDGPKHVYKSSDVDELAQEMGVAQQPQQESAPPAEEPAEETETDVGTGLLDFASTTGDTTIAPTDVLSISDADEDLQSVPESTPQPPPSQPETPALSDQSAMDMPSGLEEELAGLAEEPTASAEGGKGDTAIAAEGISIFDEEDLEIEEADPRAKTQIAPSLDDQIALDGVGSGSGLLDLTRESDDTSLGAEVLDHIDMDSGSAVGSSLTGSALGSGLSGSALGDSLEAPSVATTTPATTPAEPPSYVESVDPSSGMFGGMLIGTAVLMMTVLAVSIAAMQGVVSSLVAMMQKNMYAVLGGGVLVIVIAAVVGFMLAKSVQGKQEAVQAAG